MPTNIDYAGPTDLPERIPVFPLAGALLLPRGHMPLNIFEPRYLAMIDAALAGHRIIGMIQPREDGAEALQQIGCAGRITELAETGDGRYIIALTGISRFRLGRETTSETPFRTFEVDFSPFTTDFVPRTGEDDVDRDALIGALRAFSDVRSVEIDWDGVARAPNEALVNALSMMSPYGLKEKQALLEAPDLRTRAELLVAITEIDLSRQDKDGDVTLQ